MMNVYIKSMCLNMNDKKRKIVTEIGKISIVKITRVTDNRSTVTCDASEITKDLS